MGSPLTTLASPCSRSPPNFSSHSTLFRQSPHSYEILLLTDHTTLPCCKALTLTPFSFLHELLNAESLLTLHDNLQETPLINADFSWFTDASYLKDKSGKYAGYAIATPFEVIRAAPLPLATSAQQAELYSLTQACILAKGKTANIYTVSQYAFGVAHDFGMFWKQQSFLTSKGDDIKNGSYVQNILDAILLLVALAITRVPGLSKLNSLEAKGNHLADISVKKCCFQRD